MAAGLAMLLTGTAQAATADWLDGDWCDAGNGERLIIDERGLGFNEHTMCEWTQGRPDADAFDTVVLCANLYADGKGGWVRMDERTVRLKADRSEPDVITVTVEGGEQARFARCDW